MQHVICLITEGKSQEELEVEEQEEEEEAKNIQQRLAANLSEEDYDLNFFQVILFLLISLYFTECSVLRLGCFWCVGLCCRGEG